MRISTRLVTNIIVLFGTSFHLFAQTSGEAFTIGETLSIHSDILDEDRPFHVYLPEKYKADGQPVTVMYLLDGGSHFHHTSGIVSFMNKQGLIPDMMIVALPNTGGRTRDLTPAGVKDERTKQSFPTGGKADSLLAFFERELIPHIDKTYNTSSFRLLVGHSFGGLFAVHALVNQPALFNAYIAISPSLWWDDQYLVDQAEERFETDQYFEGFFYMTMGNEGGSMLGGAMKLAALLEEHPAPNFKWDFQLMEDENHGTVPHRSTYDGLEFIFKEWFKTDLSALYTMSNVKEIKAHFAQMSQRLGYQLSPGEKGWNTIGQRFMQRGSVQQAKEIFEQNAKEHPESWNVYYSLGSYYQGQGENKLALKQYQKVLSLHPGHTYAIQAMGELGKNYNKEKLIVTLTEEQLEAVKGKYELSIGGQMVIELNEGKLMAFVRGGVPKQQLIPFSDNRFLLEDSNIPLTFDIVGKTVKGVSAQPEIGFFITGKKIE
ncbi:MAG: hypothetical protein KTR30_17400 [Saprospiraceae bacterium]|nr:hypothetical protein [Saprospiraceae bacterium]